MPTSPLGQVTGPCPCGSGAGYVACCGPLHDGRPATTAEALMRSRYAAYVLGLGDHLFRTWHPRTRPDDVTPATDLTWLGLEVLSTEGGGEGDDSGTVEFRARYRHRDSDEHVLAEASRFVRRGGRWVYVDGATS